MFREWLKTLCSGDPHFVIGEPEKPYMLSWYLIPRNRRFNVYLHKFLRDDDARALHDHPWWFVSLILKGGYFELVPHSNGVSLKCLKRSRWTRPLAYRSATHRHRVVLFAPTGVSEPCWTVVITGRKGRTWGFWCPKGFVPWHDFVDAEDTGNVGRGCGEMS